MQAKIFSGRRMSDTNSFLKANLMGSRKTDDTGTTMETSGKILNVRTTVYQKCLITITYDITISEDSKKCQIYTSHEALLLICIIYRRLC